MRGSQPFERIARRRLRDLRRGVGVSRRQQQAIDDLPAQLDFRALGKRAIDVHVLAGEVDVVELILNLVAERVVKVHRGKRHPVAE